MLSCSVPCQPDTIGGVRRLPVLAAALVVLTLPVHARAAGPEVDAPSEDRIGARVDDARGGRPQAPAGHRRPATRRRGPATAPVTSVAVPSLRLVDGSLCLAVERRPGDPSSLVAVTDEARILQLGARHGRCAAVPRSPAQAAPPAAAGPAVRTWAEQLVLPSPSLQVRPGSAIVGKAAYLEIDGVRSARWRVDALGWLLDVDATATYTVDWGDGTVEHDVASQGGPWPTGDLRHAYLLAGVHVITVTEHWTATWTARGHGEVTAGVLAGVLRTQASLELPVVELQAVRVR